MAANNEQVFSSFMTEVKEIEIRDSVLTSEQQIERLTKPGSKYLNLNPYEVLHVFPESPEDVIKKQYRKLSFLVHPDKNRDNPDIAQKAFEAVNKAYTILHDEDKKRRIMAILDEANAMVREKLKEKKKQAKKEGKDEIEEDDAEKFKKFHHAVTVKLFADYEIKRVSQETKDAEQRKRQREDEIAQEEETKRKKEWEKQWEESRNERVDSWRNFQATSSKSSSKTKKKEKKGRTGFKPPALKPEKR